MKHESMNTGQFDILIIDHHSLIIQGLGRIIKRISDKIAFTAITSGKDAYALIHQKTFNAYILDVSLSDIDGFKIVEFIRKIQNDAYIIVNTMNNEEWITERLINNQINAIISKKCNCKEVELAIRHGLQNEAYCSANFYHLRKRLRNGLELKMHKDDLPTKRELDVLQRIAAGETSLQIASSLGITENTVETFRKRLMQKFNAKNAIDLVIKAMNKGWINIYS